MPSSSKEEMHMECMLSLLMGKQRMNIQDVADKTGLHRNVVSRYYHDKVKQFDREVVVKFLDLFGVGPGEFFSIRPKRPGDHD